MEHKNKSFSRIKRHQSDKVLRYSIRKYSFGAASVAVAALMFLGTHVVSADGVDHQNQHTIGAPNPNEETEKRGEPAENQEVAEKNTEVAVSPGKEGVKPIKEEVQPAKPEGKVEQPVQPTQPAVQPVEVKKDELSKLVDKFSALLGNVNREKVTKTSLSTTLLKIEDLLSKAKAVLQNESATQAEVDAAYKGLKGKFFIAESLQEIPKTVAEIKESL